jgi:catechol 2,3-dioxygenase-like lactoylglutathione lyase family enzyme
MRLDHVSLTVADRERSARFYGEHFGLVARVHEDEQRLILGPAGGDGLLALCEGSVPAAGLPHTNHFGFEVDDPEAVRRARSRFREAGVVEDEWQDDSGFVRVQVFDPDGYRVEIFTAR